MAKGKRAAGNKKDTKTVKAKVDDKIKKDKKVDTEVVDAKPKTSKKRTAKEEKEEKHTEMVLKELNEQIISSKQVPEQAVNTMLRRVFPNIIIAVIIMLFLNLLLFGYTNIQPETYETDVKVLAIVTVFLAIFIIEVAYKKDNARWIIYSLECLGIAFFALSLTYIYKHQVLIYQKYLVGITMAIVAYYIIKLFISFMKELKKYKKASSDIQKILK